MVIFTPYNLSMKKVFLCLYLISLALIANSQAKIERVYGIALGSTVESVKQKLKDREFPTARHSSKSLNYPGVYYGNFPNFHASFKFDKDDKLMQVWLSKSSRIEKSVAIGYYNEVVSALTAKYGVPVTNKDPNKADPSLTDDDFFKQISLEKPQYRAYWSDGSDHSIEVIIHQYGAVNIYYTHKKLFDLQAAADDAAKKKTLGDY